MSHPFAQIEASAIDAEGRQVRLRRRALEAFVPDLKEVARFELCNQYDGVVAWDALHCGRTAAGSKRMSPIKAHDRVVLPADLPGEKLAAGDVGTVVHIHRNGKACEVEFVSLGGETIAVVTLEFAQFRPVERREITHARRVA